MRRLLLASAVFLTATATPTFAGYIIIRVLLEGGGAGVPGGDTVPGGPAGIEGLGGPPSPGGLSGPPSPGGYSGSKGSKGPAMPGGIGGPGTPAPAGAGEIDHTRAVVVVIPLETDLLAGRLDMKRNPHPQFNPEFRKLIFQHSGQKVTASLFVDSSSIQLYDELLGIPAPKKTRGTEVRDRYQAWARTKSDPLPLYDAMVLALQSGFVKDALAYADELMAVAAEKKLTLPERDVKPFVAAWGAMHKAVTSPAARPGDAETWKVRLDFGSGSVRVSGHYAVISADSSAAEVERRAVQLNDNFAAFFLWHATRGVVLPVPDRPLVAVLAPQAAAMRGLQSALDGLPMADAFFSPDHNLLVLSPERMDSVGFTFLKQNQQVFATGLNRDQLLAGIIPKLDPNGQNGGSRPEDVARASTLAAVEKLVIEEAELAAVSREGTRQLMYATGTLPKHVTLPTWLTNGAVNFFTRPRGPAYVTIGEEDKPYMHVALTTGYGGPNYVLQRYFRDLATKKELPADADKLLENVLGDVYFSGIKNGDDPDPSPPKKAKKPVAGGAGPMPPGGIGPMPPGGPKQPGSGGSSGGPPPGIGGSSGGPTGIGGAGMPGPLAPGGGLGGSPAPAGDQEDPAVALRKKQQRLAIKANATSWALYYYLAKDKPSQLREYIAELNKLPRDLPIDGRTAYGVFVRVFKLSATEDGPADPKELKKFADGWLAYINTVPLVGQDVPLVVPVAPKLPAAGGLGPMPPDNPDR